MAPVSLGRLPDDTIGRDRFEYDLKRFFNQMPYGPQANRQQDTQS